MKPGLAGEILSKVWLIDESYVQSQLPFIAAIVTGERSLDQVDHSELRASLRASAVSAASGSKPLSEAAPGSIAIIPVNGPLMKQDQFCGPAGTATLTEWLQQADKNPNIDAIILKIDSPGGTVDGTETFSNAVKNTKKPVVAFVDGMMASAAMWIGSAADLIIASGQNDFIGSIGTMSSFADFQPLYEKAGVKFHSIYATLSTDKNIESREAVAGNYTPYIKNVLDPINLNFHKAIKQNRKGKVDPENTAVFSGATFLSKEAMKNGLVDEIGTFDHAVKRASDLAATNNVSLNNSNDMKFSLKSTWTALLTVFGLAAAAGQDRVEADITDEQFEKMNADLASLEALRATGAELTASNSKLTTDLAAANAKVTELEAKIAAAPAVNKTETVKEESKVKGMKGAEEWNKAEYSWNQNASKFQ